MQIAPTPFLRSPPFPEVDAATAAVSVAGDRGDRTRGTEPIAATRSLLRGARVGGCFWAAPLKHRADVVLRPGGDLADRIRAAGRLAGGGGAIAVLPHGSTDSLARDMCGAAGIAVVSEPVDPWSALGPGVTLLADAADEWALVASLAGAALPGIDPAALDRRLEQALFADVAYRDCFGDRPAPIEDVIALLADWRRILDANRRIAAATGISWWKERAIRQFLWAGAGPLPIVSTGAAAIAAATAAGGGIAVWPSRAPEGLADRARAGGIPLVAIEDGFIRSVGLGSGLHPPWSIVVDERGIYYDPRRPSDLETILATGDFPAEALARAARLRATIVARGISKYSAAAVADVARETERRIVLVAGQVEDDMSVKAAGAGVAGNLDLLARARRAEPDAYILFKPHPDVDAGHRVGRVADAALLGHADAIVRDEAMPSLLKRVDAVHVLSSLTGFEALLRGVEVVVHGQPFYAGWGLTRDLAGGLERRTRRLTLDELVAGTLIAYPRYLDPKTGLPCPPEILLERFAAQTRPETSWLIRLRGWQGRIARLFGTTTD